MNNFPRPEHDSGKNHGSNYYNVIRRELHPEVRIVSESEHLVQYVASDETVDAYREVIRSTGWRFNHFAKNAPFVDSHDYGSVEKLLGQVIEFTVRDGKLLETVKWAADVPENKLATIGWKMTQAGYLKAVSVGFWPVRVLTAWDAERPESRPAWLAQLQELGLDEANPPRAIYLEQEQIELSSVIIGANPNALARSYKAGALDDDDLHFLSNEYTRHNCPAGYRAAPPAPDSRRQRGLFLDRLQQTLHQL